MVKRDAVFTHQFCVNAMRHRPAAHPVIITFAVDQPDIQRTLLRQQGTQQTVAGRAVIFDEQRNAGSAGRGGFQRRQARIQALPGRVIGALKGEFFLQPLVFLPDQQFGEALTFVVCVGFDAQCGQRIEPWRPDAARLLFQREIALPFFRRDAPDSGLLLRGQRPESGVRILAGLHLKRLRPRAGGEQ